MVATKMADFPPNPEDGELWLPSYIIREISSTAPPPPKSAPKSKVVLPPHFRRNNPPPSRSNFQICFGSFGATSVSVANKRASAPFVSFHKPITPSTTLQGCQGRKSKAVIENYGGTGTGVFIPRSLHIVGGGAKKLPGGTGVFLNHQVAVTCQHRKKTNEKEEETLESNNKKKCCSMRKEQRTTYQYASGIRLPKDWTY